MEAKFYKHDSYLEMRRKFTGAWKNLRLEIHHQSEKFWRGETDEFDNDQRVFPVETVNELLFTLNGETTKAEARLLFSEHYTIKNLLATRIEAFIYANFSNEMFYSSEEATLEEADNPFYLPLNKYVYAEFKRRFGERWTNLSVEVYPSEFSADKTPFGAVELADDFKMTDLTRVNRLLRKDYYERDGFRSVVEKIANESVLRDDIFLADFETSLRNSGVFVRIKNDRFGIYWERSLNYDRLKDFQAAEFSETLEYKKRKVNQIFL